MQKKIIVLAIASALTAPALAFADVTMYGQANLSVDMVKNGMTQSATDYQLNSNTSRLGLKGSEDLGGGNSLVYQMEGMVGMDKGTATVLFNRDTFLGLGSATMGTVLAGQHDTPYKMATRRLDLFGDGIADNRGNQSTSNATGAPFTAPMMGAGHDARLSNVIAYVSPSMSGMSIAAATVFGAESATSSSKKGRALSLAGMYEQGPFYGTLAYQTIKAGSTGSGDLAAGGFGTANADDKNTAFKVGGSYTMDAFAVNAVIEQHTLTLSGVNSKGTNVYLAGKYNLSSTDDVKLAFTKRGATTGATNDAKQYTLGYDHSLSKATSVYALYTKLTDNTAYAADPSALSVGIKHSF
jgi:predicted porin